MNTAINNLQTYTCFHDSGELLDAAYQDRTGLTKQDNKTIQSLIFRICLFDALARCGEADPAAALDTITHSSDTGREPPVDLNVYDFAVKQVRRYCATGE